MARQFMAHLRVVDGLAQYGGTNSCSSHCCGEKAGGILQANVDIKRHAKALAEAKDEIQAGELEEEEE